jgi:hypothetical protein
MFSNFCASHFSSHENVCLFSAQMSYYLMPIMISNGFGLILFPAKVIKGIKELWKVKHDFWVID